VKKQAALHRLTGLLFSMARHVDPIRVPHRLKNAFHCRLLVLQGDYADTTSQILQYFDFILCLGDRRRIWRRRLGDSKNREIVSDLGCR